MSTFFDYFFELESEGEVPVLCPFPHKTSNGMEYLESHPSAHVNTVNGLFHCKTCGRGYNESTFMAAILNIRPAIAVRLAKAFHNDEDYHMWVTQRALTDEAREFIETLGIEEVAEELHIGALTGNALLFPVFMYDKLVDVRRYSPNARPKVRSRVNSVNGLIIPFDVWRQSPPVRMTLICAGEKDMAVARSKGFNAITLTGGENVMPISTIEFKDRHVAIVYDNDDAGKQGAYKLADLLSPVASSVRVVTKFHEVCHENKEDIADFFLKYNKTKQDLIDYITATPIHQYDPKEHLYHREPVTLLQASTAAYIGKIQNANIQVVATSDSTYTAPREVVAVKLRESSSGTDTMAVHEQRSWILEDENINDLLHLMDNNFNETTIRQNIMHLMKIPMKERNVKLETLSKATVFKAVVTDYFESVNEDSLNGEAPMEYTAYCLDHKLESGRTYFAEFKLVPHPYKGQQLIMLITHVVQANNSVSDFSITEDTKNDLAEIRHLPGTVSDRVTTMVERVKGLLGYNGNNTLIETLDLAYHTPLLFNLGRFIDVRAYLDVLVVGESRMGKSTTADVLRKTYGLGNKVSLAGNSATIAGLIGGSNKTSGGSYQTRAGIIPQNNKGLLIFEEFGKCNANIIRELTDIRSSNTVRITRVSGTLTLPAMVRMISLTNVKNTGSALKPIASYPNGVSIVTELVGSAEDIARYDIMLVLGDPGNSRIDPYWSPEEPFSDKIYQTRIRWVWSRTASQIVINREVGEFIAEKANELNQVYDSHIKIFGTEAWKKLARFSIAVAGYLVSTDDSYNNIIVQKEHVTYAYEYYKRIYDNTVFKLKEYVEHQRQYMEIDEQGIKDLRILYSQSPGLLGLLIQTVTTNQKALQAAAGMDSNRFNNVMNQLLQKKFLSIEGHEVIPTQRFRLGMEAINTTEGTEEHVI